MNSTRRIRLAEITQLNSDLKPTSQIDIKSTTYTPEVLELKTTENNLSKNLYALTDVLARYKAEIQLFCPEDLDLDDCIYLYREIAKMNIQLASTFTPHLSDESLTHIYREFTSERFIALINNYRKITDRYELLLQAVTRFIQSKETINEKGKTISSLDRLHCKILESNLIMPIQRPPRYRLLISEMKKISRFAKLSADNLRKLDILEEHIKQVLSLMNQNVKKPISDISFKALLRRSMNAQESAELSEDPISINLNDERDLLPSERKKRNRAKSFIQAINKECVGSLIYLSDIISQEARKLPVTSHYLDIDNHFHIQLNEFDIDRLAYDLVFAKRDFAKGSANQKATSRKLFIAAKSYVATKKLYNILKNERQDPIARLENFRDEYHKKETKTALYSQPDSKVVSFFKKTGFYLANFFSCGVVSFLANRYFASPQQKLIKKADVVIAMASRERVLKRH